MRRRSGLIAARCGGMTAAWRAKAYQKYHYVPRETITDKPLYIGLFNRRRRLLIFA
jgi:hypothetical protein